MSDITLFSERDWDGSQQAEIAGWNRIVDQLQAENAALWAFVRAADALEQVYPWIVPNRLPEHVLMAMSDEAQAREDLERYEDLPS